MLLVYMYTRGHIFAHSSYSLLYKHPCWPELSDVGGARAGLVLHKKSSQTLSVSPESPFDCNFFFVGSVLVYSFIKKFPNLQGPPLPLPHLRAQAIKGVYVINYSCYVQKYDLVCKYNLKKIYHLS